MHSEEVPKCQCGCGRPAHHSPRHGWSNWARNHHPQKTGKRAVPWNLGNSVAYKHRCKTCKKRFKNKFKEADFCSRACYHAHYSGENSPHWAGGVRTKYRYVKVPRKTEGPTQVQKIHRVVMEALLERKLRKAEVVHHIDGDGTRNVVSNLHLFHCDGCHQHFHKTKAPLQYVYAGVHL